jgi:hypothetical protein
MNLGTFGAILSFAIQKEKESQSFYEAACERSISPLMCEYAKAAAKRAEKLEEARREGVTEMILESIQGLDGETYALDIEPLNAANSGVLQQAITLERVLNRFYNDAAARLPIREVVRLLQRLADESKQHEQRLIGLTI